MKQYLVLTLILLVLSGNSWATLIHSNTVCNTAGQDCFSATVDDVANRFSIHGSNMDNFIHFSGLLPSGSNWASLAGVGGVSNNSSPSLIIADAQHLGIGGWQIDFAATPNLRFAGFQEVDQAMLLTMSSTLFNARWIAPVWESVAPVSEPGTLVLVLLGGLGVLMGRRLASQRSV